ncbi:hypothetical protein T11_13756 [Trichinella zimbabwensis]|uniref:Uncharacterized protein n=1 Tax=Trichinella zimbabwensis TaxID=268475 RepID=A0A0V1F3D5_9BILA|nr:hypothetical protein T11_13756 [Trichinella zimbabwensis]
MAFQSQSPKIHILANKSMARPIAAILQSLVQKFSPVSTR